VRCALPRPPRTSGPLRARPETSTAVLIFAVTVTGDPECAVAGHIARLSIRTMKATKEQAPLTFSGRAVRCGPQHNKVKVKSKVKG
jgi:hypothetical protein